MSGKTNRTSRISASVLIFCNFVTMFFCITIFGFSLWVIASPSSFAGAVNIFGTPTLKALLAEDAPFLEMGISVAMLSGFFFFISFMGFYGAITGSQFLLFMYAALVILLLLLECAVMYYISSNLVEKGIQERNSYLTHAIRLTLQCCEQNITISPPDGKAPPWSCCGAETYPKNCTLDRVYPTGCHQAVINWLKRYETPIYVCLAISHIILSLCSLLRRALSASHSYS
ncbi:uncharacterized protein LOC123878443 [Maniola jurtina]|uniref:uncharacterized protein LOC123878443 n=1 Tax=Maniola jurtina TaxID=191418 RepID=UPI001E688EC2|nr:uncharacterized protein LOC123878443 [Maniola jurtina]